MMKQYDQTFPDQVKAVCQIYKLYRILQPIAKKKLHPEVIFYFFIDISGGLAKYSHAFPALSLSSFPL